MMYKIPLGEIKERLIQSGRITATELEQRIKKKINELSGLISEEGAAHIIANELSVELVSQGNGKLKVKEIYAGMRNVSVIGKVVRKFDVRHFEKGDKKGKVCSIILGDETGTVRVVFWNDQVDIVEKVQEGDIILVKESYVRENNDNKEIHLGEKGEIEVNPAGETVGEVRKAISYERKTIAELQGKDESVELLSTVVQVFDPRFFTINPETGKRAYGDEQGEVSYVLNAILDDGTGTIRAVFWKNQTNHLLGREDVTQFKDNLHAFEDIKTDLLGEQIKVKGKVKKNEMFDRLEFNVQLVEKANPEEELKHLEGKK